MNVHLHYLSEIIDRQLVYLEKLQRCCGVLTYTHIIGACVVPRSMKFNLYRETNYCVYLMLHCPTLSIGSDTLQ